MRTIVAISLLAGIVPSAAAQQGVTPARAAEMVAGELASLPIAQVRLVNWPPDVRAVARALAPMRPFAGPREAVTLDRLLGAAAEQTFDAPVALAHYRAALAGGAAGDERTAVLLGIARVEAWSDAAAARQTLALLDAEPMAAAAAGQLRGRMALAAGDVAGARSAFSAARQAATMLSAADQTAMLQSLLADQGVAAAMSGDTAQAATIYAATGLRNAGKNGQIAAVYATSAQCVPGGPEPDDHAIFEVAVGDIAPTRVTLVAASRPQAVAGLGAMLSAWEWAPATTDDPPARAAGFRVRVACAITGEPPIPAMTDLWPMPIDWFIARGIALPRDDAPLPALRAGLASAGAAGQPAGATVPWLLQLAIHPQVHRAERKRLLAQAVATSRDAGVPFALAGFTQMMLIDLERGRTAIDQLATIIAATPPDSANRIIADYARLRLSDFQFAAGRRDEAQLTLAAVRDAPPLARSDDPGGWHAVLRQLAATRLAFAGDSQDGPSDARFAAISWPIDACIRGPQQPVLIFKPKIDYPKPLGAQQVGGRVNLRLDLDREGRVTAVRAVSSFPAGLLEQPAIDAARQLRFGAPPPPGRALKPAAPRLPCRDHVWAINFTY